MIIDKRLKILVHRDPWKRDFGLMIGAENSDGSFSAVKNLTFEPLSEGHYASPTLTIRSETAQALFDELWNAGLRPLDGTGNGGHIGALERHLDDMRKLAGVKDK